MIFGFDEKMASDKLKTHQVPWVCVLCEEGDLDLALEGVGIIGPIGTGLRLLDKTFPVLRWGSQPMYFGNIPTDQKGLRSNPGSN